MPDRIVRALEWTIDCLVAIVTGALLVVDFTFITVLAAISSLLHMCYRIKRDIDKNHQGKISEYFKYFLNKHKNEKDSERD